MPRGKKNEEFRPGDRVILTDNVFPYPIHARGGPLKVRLRAPNDNFSSIVGPPASWFGYQGVVMQVGYVVDDWNGRPRDVDGWLVRVYLDEEEFYVLQVVRDPYYPAMRHVGAGKQQP
jgi:hypothetical protein